MYSWTLVVVVISALATLTEQRDPGRKCRYFEVALPTPRKDVFCRPELTSAVHLDELRKCVCKPGYVRNAWGACIPDKHCMQCKKWPNADYHTCESACPLTCGKPMPTMCALKCRLGCACPPGYVRGSGKKFECISVKTCPPKCQPNSTFELCKSGCEPRCSKPAPKDDCVPKCRNGGCVCEKGFAETLQRGMWQCVPWDKCPKSLY
uniref:TIL domain containing protein n=1 Tax=Rhipicephalus appendiculatus TaxID=34631 RepID=A0A131YQY0_RHIAP